MSYCHHKWKPSVYNRIHCVSLLFRLHILHAAISKQTEKEQSQGKIISRLKMSEQWHKSTSSAEK